MVEEELSLLYRVGLRLGEDGKKCVDIDECAEGTSQCEQECVNKDPRDSGLLYVCKCHGGYSIDIENQHKCIPKVITVPCSSFDTPSACPAHEMLPTLFKRLTTCMLNAL